MNDDSIVTVWAVVDEVLGRAPRARLAPVGDAEVLTVAMVPATYFHNRQARAVQVMQGMGYPVGAERLALQPTLAHPGRRARPAVGDAGSPFTEGDMLLLDSLLVSVYRR